MSKTIINENSNKEISLIELGENKQNNFTMVTKSIKDVLTRKRMPIEEENSNNGEFNLMTLQNVGEVKVMVHINYREDRGLIMLGAYYGEIPKNKRKQAAELINLMNIKTILSRIVMKPNSGDVENYAEIIIAKWFNPEEFSLILTTLLISGVYYLVAAGMLLSTNKSPASIMDIFDKGAQKVRNKKKRLSKERGE